MTPKLRNTFLMGSAGTAVAACTYAAGSMGYIPPDYHNIGATVFSAGVVITARAAFNGVAGYMREKRKNAEIEAFMNTLGQMAQKLREEDAPAGGEMKRPLNETRQNARPEFPRL